MNKFSVMMVLAFALSACDTNQAQSPQTEVRTMIIGGMPVHEHDYKLPKSDQMASETKLTLLEE